VVGHRARGTVESVDRKDGKITLAHGAIPTMKWPPMTMDFMLANAALAARVKPGSAVSFEFVERKPGEYVITKLEPDAAASSGRR
jgi:Cu(I)/Ag(I) efflux system membrane fusion protein